MNALQEKLFLELRLTKEEIENSLKGKQKQNWLAIILKAELEDVNAAIQKFEEGNFGQCEISGELLPESLLKMIPTIKSHRDSKYLDIYFKKSIY